MSSVEALFPFVSIAWQPWILRVLARISGRRYVYLLLEAE